MLFRIAILRAGGKVFYTVPLIIKLTPSDDDMIS